MAQVSRTTAKSYFNTGDTPTEQQFANFIESANWFDDAVALTVNGIAPVSGNIVLTTDNVADSSNKRYVTDAGLAVLAETSGTNTGDETLETIKTKLGAASGLQDGYLTAANWTTFNAKQAALVSGTNIKTVNGNSLLGSGDLSISGGSGTVTTVSVVSANGLAGSVSNATTTPAITLSTSVTGLLKGDGTAVSAATPGTDYEPVLTFATGLTRAANTITNNLSTGVSGGQTMYGGTGANDDLTIHGTSNSTRTTSYVLLQPTAGFVGIGTTTPASTLDVQAPSSTYDPMKLRTTVNDGYASCGLFDFNNTQRASFGWAGAGSGAPLTNSMFFQTATGSNSPILFFTNLIERLRIQYSGNIGVKNSSPTALLHIAAGTATANTAPLKLTAGTLLSTPENGAFEVDGSGILYFTVGGVRKTVTLV